MNISQWQAFFLMKYEFNTSRIKGCMSDALIREAGTPFFNWKGVHHREILDEVTQNSSLRKMISNGWEKHIKNIYFSPDPCEIVLKTAEICSENIFRDCRKVYVFSILSLKKALKTYAFLPSFVGWTWKWHVSTCCR